MFQVDVSSEYMLSLSNQNSINQSINQLLFCPIQRKKKHNIIIRNITVREGETPKKDCKAVANIGAKMLISTENNFFIFILELTYNILVILDGKLSI